MKKLYYCVVSKYFDDGRAYAVVKSVYEEEKPVNEYKSFNMVDVYHDYFDTLREAEEFAENIHNN